MAVRISIKDIYATKVRIGLGLGWYWVGTGLILKERSLNYLGLNIFYLLKDIITGNCKCGHCYFENFSI